MKKAIIIASVLIAAGLILCAGALFASGFDFSRFAGENFETNTYAVTADFQRIEINTDTADIILKPSDDGGVRAVCVETEKAGHSVTVTDGTLKIADADERQWYDHIGIFWGSPSITLYLPVGEYEVLTVDGSTGDVDIPDGFSFINADITVSTGDVAFNADSTGFVKIKTSTGNIAIDGVSAREIDLSVSTGHINAEQITCAGRMSAKVSTGKTWLCAVNCGSFESEGSTGKVVLEDTVAAGELYIKRSTGDIFFENSDAETITIKTSTGDVTGSLRTEKVFLTNTSTGKISVPKTASGGKCEITTSTGDIEIDLAGSNN